MTRFTSKISHIAIFSASSFELHISDESVADGQGSPPASLPKQPLGLRLPVRSRRVVVVDYMGRRRTLAPAGGMLRLELGPGPQYVVDGPAE